MEKPTNKIMAIKLIRELPLITEMKTVETTNYGSKEYLVTRINLSLKEAKDLVEAIMALQDSQYIVDNLEIKIDNLKAETKKWKEAYIQLRDKINTALDETPSICGIDNDPPF